MKFIAIVLVAFSLLGCQSEIDKCVEAGMKASGSNKKTPTEKASDEFGFRDFCLKSAAGR